MPVTWEELLKRLSLGQDERTVFLPPDLSPEELARYAAGLANHRGGTLFLGVDREGRVVGASEIHPLQITHALFQLTQGLLLPYVEVVEGPLGRVLALHVPQSPAAIAVGAGRVPFWDGRRLTELRMGQALPEPDFTAQVLPAASLSDLDPVEVLRLRRILEERGSNLAALPDLELLYALGLLERVEGEERPTVAGLLLAGTPLALRRLLPQAEVSYYFHEGEEGYTFREDMLRPIPALLERLRDLIQARNRVRYLMVGLFRLEVWDFDQEVYREALLNALVHRDWQSPDAIQVHHYPDRLEVSNPGGFPPGITPENILRHPPKKAEPPPGRGPLPPGLRGAGGKRGGQDVPPPPQVREGAPGVPPFPRGPHPGPLQPGAGRGLRAGAGRGPGAPGRLQPGPPHRRGPPAPGGGGHLGGAFPGLAASSRSGPEGPFPHGAHGPFAQGRGAVPPPKAGPLGGTGASSFGKVLFKAGVGGRAGAFP